MVKTDSSHNSSKTKTSPNLLEIEIEAQLKAISLSTLHNFIQVLLKYQKVQKTCKNIKKAYGVLAICLLLQGQIQPLPKLKNNTVIAMKQLFDLQKSKNSLESNSFLFQLIQNILNATISYINSQAKIAPLNQISSICLQLLKVSASVRAELVITVILRLLQNECRASVYSYLINPFVPFLPLEKKTEFTLVLDLDETLGHFSEKRFFPRPGVLEFLASMSKKFELVLFTSSAEAYANYAMSIIDPQNLVNWRLYRQHLIIGHGKVSKDLRVLGRDLNKVIIVDNDPKYFENQPMNGIQIKSWYGEKDDEELKKLGVFFEGLELTGSKTAAEVVEELSNIELLTL